MGDIYQNLDTVKLENWHSQEVAVDIVQRNTAGGTTELISSNTVVLKRRCLLESGWIQEDSKWRSPRSRQSTWLSKRANIAGFSRKSIYAAFKEVEEFDFDDEKLCARRRWWSYLEEEANLSSFLTIVPNTIGIYGQDAEKCAECTQAGRARSHASML